MLITPADRKELIDRHNLLLLERLERIHEQQVPSQFDISHHSRAVLDAPRLTNDPRRRREGERIAAENRDLDRRLQKAKGTFNNKQLAADADRHRYLSDQISKVQRREKVKHKLQTMAASKREAFDREQESLYLKMQQNGNEDREYMLAMLPPKLSQQQQHQETWNRSPARQKFGNDVLPAVVRSHPHFDPVRGPTGSPTLTNTSKLISAKELLRMQ